MWGSRNGKKVNMEQKGEAGRRVIIESRYHALH